MMSLRDWPAHPGPGPTVEVARDEVLKEELYRAKLPSGLEIFVLPKKGFARKYATFATRYGSVDSKFVVPGEVEPAEVPEGIAHFLEHKLFEEEWGSVFDKFAELGADCNAYTDYTTTTYLFSATDHFSQCLDLLIDFVQRPYFTDENVAKEKGIIEQELRMYLDDPGERVRVNLLQALYQKHPVRVEIGGTVESIQRIDKETLYRCYRTFYHPSNMVVFVVGEVDPRGVIEQVAGNVARKGYGPQAEIRRLFPEEPDDIEQAWVSADLSVSQPLFRMGFKDVRTGGDGADLVQREAVTRVILEALVGKGSTLYQRLYEEGLVDARFGADYTVERDFGYSTIGGETKDPERLQVLLLNGINAARDRGIPAADFERCRRKLAGEALSLLDNFPNLAYTFNDWYFKGALVFDYLKALQSLTLEAVNDRLREHLDTGLHAVSVVYPKEGR